jgi:hypothetical protein
LKPIFLREKINNAVAKDVTARYSMENINTPDRPDRRNGTWKTISLMGAIVVY